MAIDRVTGTAHSQWRDTLAVEEPLEIRVAFRDSSAEVQKSISITMRTPGNDFELACGFLFTEGIVRRAEDVASVRHCGPGVGASSLQNVVRVELAADVQVDLKRLERHFYTSSSCGVCGKTSIEALNVTGLKRRTDALPTVEAETVHRLPETLRGAQDVFSKTGGLHAAGLFDTHGALLSLREDVGRHNALDKLIGAELLAARLPASDKVLVVSGRASFELVQKAVVAGIPIMAAVGAPSSLAVELAERYGMTLLGFVRDERFNIYCGKQRLP
ncbi:MAG TPA: formate dehydrogenase accessory sulfurtransferase FdhD [Pirellulales bacterium]|nr:formate dehydrogenase accessory sulfurtransferase FdhD [Pirellulales bacterium]